jgi:hypothetical protein
VGTHESACDIRYAKNAAASRQGNLQRDHAQRGDSMAWEKKPVTLPAGLEEELTDDELEAEAGPMIIYPVPSGDFVAVSTTNAYVEKRATCGASRHRRRHRGTRHAGRTNDSKKKDHVGRTYLTARLLGSRRLTVSCIQAWRSHRRSSSRAHSVCCARYFCKIVFAACAILAKSEKERNVQNRTKNSKPLAC